MHRIYRTLWLIVVCGALPCMSLAQDLPFGISLPPSINFATSPAPVGSGARAAGKAFAFIAVADDATAASHNPGGLVQLERPEVSIVGSYFIRFEDQDVTQANTVVDDQTVDKFNLNYLSAVYPFRLLQRNVVVSVNFQRLFDLNGETDVTSRFNTIDGTQEVSSDQDGGLFTISPAVAVQITPTFSLGVAFNIWPELFDNGWDQDVSVRSEGRVVSGNRIVPFDADGKIDEDFDVNGFNYNFTIGFLWSINRIFTLGGVVRTPFTLELTRKHSSELTVTLRDGSSPVPTSDRFKETLDMDFPVSYGLGLAVRFSDSFTLSLDVSRVHWSDFEFDLGKSDRAGLLIENGAPTGRGTGVLNGDGDDTTSVRLGAEYLWITQTVVVPFRAGFFYDPEPSDDGTDDFFGFSLGTGITVGRFVGDIAYIFRTGTVESEATDTTIYQHKVLASIIFHF